MSTTMERPPPRSESSSTSPGPGGPAPAPSTSGNASTQPYFAMPQQQQPGGWTPSLAAQPFYPQNNFYAATQQQFPQYMGYDPQMAQWAYQQMMFQAQQQHQQQQQHQHSPHGQQPPPPPQQNRANSNDYFAQNVLAPGFNAFPSGTPPPPLPQQQSQQQQQSQGQGGQQQQPYQGFHPYRRPTRQGTTDSQQGSSAPNEWQRPPPPAPPNGRARTDSMQSAHSHDSDRDRDRAPGHLPPHPPKIRSGSNSSGSSSSSIPAVAPRLPHHRSSSSSSASSGRTPSPRINDSLGSPPPSASATARRPSPLASSTPFTASSSSASAPSGLSTKEKRMSRDDSDLAAMMSSDKDKSSKSLGRLRSALSRFNSDQKVDEQDDDDDDVSIKASDRGQAPGKDKMKAKNPIAKVTQPPGRASTSARGPPPSPSATSTLRDDDSDHASQNTATASDAPVGKKKRGPGSLFNSRFNRSTDNISLSSTVSSASVMIRKLGNVGKLARRNSLAGITSLFKDKDKDKEKEKDGEGKEKKKDKKSKKSKSAKAEASEASVSHVTAELDRGDWTVGAGPGMEGLSPAAKLARQHTLRSRAEEEAREKERKEREGVNGATGVNGWDRNTATRTGSPSKGGSTRVAEDGTRVFVEDDDDDSDPESTSRTPHFQQGSWDEDSWDGHSGEDSYGVDEEEDTVRLPLPSAPQVHAEVDSEDEDVEPWGERGIEKDQRPMKGILKNAGTYDQHRYGNGPTSDSGPGGAGGPNTLRGRSNSYNAASTNDQPNELGPLARIPSPDPDHIDGLHRHGSHSSQHSHRQASESEDRPPKLSASGAPSLPPLSFDSPVSDSPTPTKEEFNPLGPHPPSSSSQTPMFAHPNSSAPTLSLSISASASGPSPGMGMRAATTPSMAKRLAFANNLSVYDTFAASVYDRRSEPATWSRLTPALAQRIKEELNSYKMEEMEVHAASRIHTQFFV